MNRVETTSKVRVYEVCEEELPIGADKYLVVKSHWNMSELVLLSFNNEITITVSARDLMKAIGRCSE